MKAYPIQEWDSVLISFVKNNPLSMQAIRKKLLWKKINNEEVAAIVEDIQNNKLSDLALAYYTATSFFYKTDLEELVYTTIEPNEEEAREELERIDEENQIKAVAVGAGAVCLSAAAAAIPVPGVNSLLNLVPMWST